MYAENWGLFQVVECIPQDANGMTEIEYEKSVLQAANISITVDSDKWANSTSVSVKKDFIAGLIKSIKGNIYVNPHVVVSDGFRTVAEGSWSIWNNDVDITLK